MSRIDDSPIVQTVRKAREKLAAECGNDLGKLIEMLRRSEKASGRATASPRRSKSSRKA